MDTPEEKSVRHGILHQQKANQEGHAGQQKSRTIFVAGHSKNVR